MANHAECDWLNLEAGFSELLDGIEPEMETEVERAVGKVTRKGAKELRAKASERWNGETGSRYSEGFASHVTKAGSETTGEIGNKNVPGLVHLLEKGHVTMGGTRTKAYPHLAPVYEQIAPEAFSEVADAVGRALEA